MNKPLRIFSLNLLVVALVVFVGGWARETGKTYLDTVTDIDAYVVPPTLVPN